MAALSPNLRALVSELENRYEADSEYISSMIIGSVMEYREGPVQEIHRGLRDTSLMNVRMWYHSLLNDFSLPSAELDAVRRVSEHRVHQGISLDAVAQAYRVGASAIWEIMLKAAEDQPELHHELLFKVSPYLLVHFDSIAREIAQAYTAEQNRSGRWRSRLRAEVWNIIRNRPEDNEGFRRNIEALGCDPAIPHCSVAFTLAKFPDFASNLELEFDQILDNASRVFEMTRQRIFHVFHADRFILLLPTPVPARPLDFDNRLYEKAQRICAGSKNIVAAGIGLPGVGPGGWGVSVEQALKALAQDGAERDSAVFRYSEIMLDDAIARSTNAANFLDSIIDGLSQEPNLLETLTAYFSNCQHRKTTAAALHVHPNTLDYRLSRIEEALGAKLDDPAWISRLYTALSRANLITPCEKS
jgi:carbohydrate diacid regulator